MLLMDDPTMTDSSGNLRKITVIYAISSKVAFRQLNHEAHQAQTTLVSSCKSLGFFATGSLDCTIGIWDTVNRLFRKLELPCPVLSLVFLGCTGNIVFASNEEIWQIKADSYIPSTMLCEHTLFQKPFIKASDRNSSADADTFSATAQVKQGYIRDEIFVSKVVEVSDAQIQQAKKRNSLIAELAGDRVLMDASKNFYYDEKDNASTFRTSPAANPIVTRKMHANLNATRRMKMLEDIDKMKSFLRDANKFDWSCTRTSVYNIMPVKPDKKPDPSALVHSGAAPASERRKSPSPVNTLLPSSPIHGRASSAIPAVGVFSSRNATVNDPEFGRLKASLPDFVSQWLILPEVLEWLRGVDVNAERWTGATFSRRLEDWMSVASYGERFAILTIISTLYDQNVADRVDLIRVMKAAVHVLMSPVPPSCGVESEKLFILTTIKLIHLKGLYQEHTNFLIQIIVEFLVANETTRAAILDLLSLKLTDKKQAANWLVIMFWKPSSAFIVVRPPLKRSTKQRRSRTHRSDKESMPMPEVIQPAEFPPLIIQKQAYFRNLRDYFRGKFPANDETNPVTSKTMFDVINTNCQEQINHQSLARAISKK